MQKNSAMTRFFLGVLALAFSAAALAHQTKLSSSVLVPEGSSIEATLELNGVDLNVATGVTLTNEAGEVSSGRLESHRGAVFDYLVRHVRLAIDGGAQCSAAQGALRAKRDHVVATLRLRCPPHGGPLQYRVTLFHEVDPAARHIVTVAGAERRFGLLSATQSGFVLSGSAPDLVAVLWRYLAAGVEHIAIGYDHIAFLLAVIVPARRFWPLFAVITAFTIAHSLTLSLAVLGVVTLPGRFVEAAIAASVVYVAAENFFVRDLRHRWWVTFAFGLVHGFGFASVLREYGIPQHAIVPALAAFNVGVEIGQLIVVFIAVLAWRALFALAALRGRSVQEPARRRIALAVSAAVLGIGLYWLVQRTVFWSPAG